MLEEGDGDNDECNDDTFGDCVVGEDWEPSLDQDAFARDHAARKAGHSAAPDQMESPPGLPPGLPGLGVFSPGPTFGATEKNTGPRSTDSASAGLGLDRIPLYSEPPAEALAPTRLSAAPGLDSLRPIPTSSPPLPLDSLPPGLGPPKRPPSSPSMLAPGVPPMPTSLFGSGHPLGGFPTPLGAPPLFPPGFPPSDEIRPPSSSSSRVISVADLERQMMNETLGKDQPSPAPSPVDPRVGHRLSPVELERLRALEIERQRLEIERQRLASDEAILASLRGGKGAPGLGSTSPAPLGPHSASSAEFDRAYRDHLQALATAALIGGSLPPRPAIPPPLPFPHPYLGLSRPPAEALLRPPWPPGMPPPVQPLLGGGRPLLPPATAPLAPMPRGPPPNSPPVSEPTLPEPPPSLPVESAPSMAVESAPSMIAPFTTKHRDALRAIDCGSLGAERQTIALAELQPFMQGARASSGHPGFMNKGEKELIAQIQMNQMAGMGVDVFARDVKQTTDAATEKRSGERPPRLEVEDTKEEDTGASIADALNLDSLAHH